MPRRLVLGSIVTMMVAACASAGTSSQAPATGQPGPDWQLVFQLSGGFAGMDRVLEVSSTGALAATDRRGRTRVTAQVPAAEMSRLAPMVMRTYPPSPPDTPCADCRLFDLDVRAGGRSTMWHLTDITRSGNELDPLVTALGDLLDRALAGRLPSP